MRPTSQHSQGEVLGAGWPPDAGQVLLEAIGEGHCRCICRSVWGARVEAEPQDYTPYSTHRPDLVAHLHARNGKSLVLDTKVAR